MAKKSKIEQDKPADVVGFNTAAASLTHCGRDAANNIRHAGQAQAKEIGSEEKKEIRGRSAIWF